MYPSSYVPPASMSEFLDWGLEVGTLARSVWYNRRNRSRVASSERAIAYKFSKITLQIFIGTNTYKSTSEYLERFGHAHVIKNTIRDLCEQPDVYSQGNTCIIKYNDRG